MKRLTFFAAMLAITLGAQAASSEQPLPAEWSKFSTNEVALHCINFAYEVADSEVQQASPDKAGAISALKLALLWSGSVTDLNPELAQKVVKDVQDTTPEQAKRQADYCVQKGASIYSGMSVAVQSVINGTAVQRYEAKLAALKKAKPAR